MLADEIHRAHQRCLREDSAEVCDVHAKKTDFVFEAGAATMRLLQGAYACIALIKGVGLLAFRDPLRHQVRIPPTEPERSRAWRWMCYAEATWLRWCGCQACSPGPRMQAAGAGPQSGLQRARSGAWPARTAPSGPIGFHRERDVRPGEMIVITEQGMSLRVPRFTWALSIAVCGLRSACRLYSR